jgi:oligopeptidase B
LTLRVSLQVKVSPSHTLLAYLVDYTGDEHFELVVVDLASGERRPDTVSKISRTLCWGDDDSLFYLTKDATKRPHRLWRHVLGTPAESDALLHEEGDAKFWLGAYKSRSGRFLFAHAGSKETSEIQFIDLKAEGARDAKLRPIEPRAHGLKYTVRLGTPATRAPTPAHARAPSARSTTMAPTASSCGRTRTALSTTG